METEVDGQLGDLSLRVDEDDVELPLDSGSEVQVDGRVYLCLIGKFLSGKTLNFMAMKSRLSAVWRPVRGVYIKSYTSNLFLFQFFHSKDLKRVLIGGPWFFDNCPLIYKRLQDGDIPTSVQLFHLNIWVRLFDIPVGYVKEAVAKLLGDYIGSFLEYDAKNAKDVWNNYMRVRVQIDIRKPLKKHKVIKKRDGSTSKVRFVYERLPSFCFVCGILGHLDRFFPKTIDFVGEDSEIVREWTSELRAPTRNVNIRDDDQWLRDGEGSRVSESVGGDDGVDEEEEELTSTLVSTRNPSQNMVSASNKGKAIMPVNSACMKKGFVMEAIIPFDKSLTIKGGRTSETYEGSRDLDLLEAEDRKRRRASVAIKNQDTDMVIVDSIVSPNSVVVGPKNDVATSLRAYRDQ